jgi:hypothetical protein
MNVKTKTISATHVASLKAILTGHAQMRQRVDAVNEDLERLHNRITRLMLRLLEDSKRA